jgi:hypothetical protein
VIAGALAVVTAGTGMAMGTALPAAAAPVYEITAGWADGTPARVATGEVINSEWRVNVNDDAAAPSNGPVSDVTFTVTATNGTIVEIPDACLTTGVTPASSISDDRLTLTCNVGPVHMGTSAAVQVPVVANGDTGDRLSLLGAIQGAQAAPLPEIPIENPFGMDIRWGSTNIVLTHGSGYVDVPLQWTLSANKGSDPGPANAVYDLTIAATNGSVTSVAPAACSAFNGPAAIGHPWSAGTHPADQTAPFVQSCSLVKTGANTYQLTLSGINYSRTQVPTRDSAGRALPLDQDAIASGQISIRVNTTTGTTLELTSNAPTYIAPSGQRAVDDAANNTSAKTITFPGGWASVFNRNEAYMNTGGSSWTDDIRVSPGTTIYQQANGSVSPRESGTTLATCSVLDTRYVSYTGLYRPPGWNTNLTNPVTAWYIGTDATVNPSSPSYNPANFNCGIATGWTTTEPADKSLVKAVRVTLPVAPNRGLNYGAFVLGRLKDDAPVGQNVWQFGNWARDGVWTTSMASGGGTRFDDTTGARYPYTTEYRDILRVISATPFVQKVSDRDSVKPGEPANFTLRYSANGAGAIPPTVDGYRLVDTLPRGMSYVVGSATPAPQVSTNASGQQVLTWTLNGVTTNTTHALTYQAVAGSDVRPGSVLTNTVAASYGGQTRDASESVTVSTNGYTQIGKTTDQWFIANPDGDGSGESGSWTVTVRSVDPLPSAFTDTIDILPFNGDDRGTDFEGTYEVTAVDAPAGATVYYTDEPPATLSDDPNAQANGSAGNPSSLWSTTKPANPTAVRVVGGELAPGATFAFTVHIKPDGAQPGDVYVNRAQAIAEHTELVMRTSEPLTMGTRYSVSLKKYVRDADGNWVDASDPVEYPRFREGDAVNYRVVVTNTGQGTLRDLTVSDDKQPQLGSFEIDELAPGEDNAFVHEYEVTLGEDVPDSIVNTACVSAPRPADTNEDVDTSCDPAGITVDGEPTHDKTLVSATPIGEGRWELVYGIEVSNASTHPTSYSLEDDLAFTDQATVVSAAVTESPDGVTLADPAWDGVANPRIASNVPLAGNDDPGYGVHHYELTVVAEVPLQLDGAGSGAGDPTQCGAEDDRSDRAFANHSALRDASGEVETDRACAPIPSIEITKGVSQGPTPNGDGTWTVVYDIVATNDGAEAGVYDVTDRMTADGDLEVVSGRVVTTPEGVAASEDWTGFGPDQTSPENVIATDVTLPAGASHTYQVEVVLGIADGTDGAPVITPCSALGAGPGGLSNTAQVEHNGLTADDDACVTIAYITVDKSVSSGPTPNDDGTWTVVYDIVAENVGGDTGEYEVTDRLHFGEGIEILDAAVTTTPDGIEARDSWTGLGDDGAAENVIASGVELAAGASHTYQVEVTVRMDEATIDPAALACPPPGSDEAGGLGNSTSLDHNGIVAIDEVCPSLPLIRFAKTISDGPAPVGDGQWAITYDLTARNVGQAAGDYDLVDQLRYGAGIDVHSADVVTAPQGVTLEAGWTGQSAEESAAENVVAAGVELARGAAHTYQVRVVVSLDRDTVTPETLTCPEPGSGEPGGLANTGVLTHNGEDQTGEVCATLPLIGVDKTVSAGPTPNEDGTWTVVYDIVATNTGKADGTYDVVDRMESTTGEIAVESAEVVTAPDGVTTNDAWTGQGAQGAPENVIASGIALPAGGVHTYQVRAVVSLADDAVGVPAVADCTTGQAGGLANDADVVSNGETVSDDACIKLADITVDKSVSSGPTPNGDGTYTVVYEIVAENVGGAVGAYEVTDRLHFGDGIEIDSAKATGPDGVDVRDTWTGLGADGAAENVIASGVELAAGQQHTYRVTVAVQLDEATIDPAVLACPPPGTGQNGGLANSTTLTHNGITAEDEVCPTLPLIEFTKTISAGPTANGDGTWTITYDLTAHNAGQAAGDYDLVDELRYGAGIDIASAKVITAPEGVDVNQSWTGRGKNTIATGVELEQDATHTYQVQVVVSLDEDVVTPATLACPEPGSGEPGGLANTGVLTHNGQTQDDEVCATLPLIEVTKSLSGAVTLVEGEPGQYDAAYELTVTNRGPGAGQYDLADTLAPGEGVEVVGIQDVTTDAQGAELSESFDGLEDTRIVSDQPIAAAPQGATVVHTYTVVVRYAVDLAEVEVPAGAQCADGDGGTVPGALNNTASIEWNGITDADDECVRPGKPTLDKALVSAEPVGDGKWEVVYDLTVGNVGAEATTYDLDDELLFAPVITAENVAVTGPDGVALNEGFDGAEHRRIATDVTIAGLDDEGYAPHVYRVTVTAGVPLHFDAADVQQDGTGSPACTTPAGGNLTAQGLNNAATLTDETGDTVTDTDCAPVPSFEITKTVDGDPVLEDGAWTVNYRIDVVNDGATAGAYDLVDRLRYGTGIQVQTATVTEAPQGVQVTKGWTGRGEEGDATNVITSDVQLAAGTTHTYQVQVVATVDAKAANASTWACPEPGSDQAGGFANTAGMGHNGLTDTAEACATPKAPAPSVDDPDTVVTPIGTLPKTGIMIGTLVGAAALLLLLGLLALHAARRRTTS